VKHTRGVTLIELMIVMAVIGILSAIAVPAYKEHVLKGRRAAAKAMLYEVLQHSERFYSENNTFTTDMADLGYGAGPYLSENGSHTITLADGPSGDISTSVTISATPVAADDAKCTALSLSSNMAKAATGTAAGACW
jgi:type IV pilus assembly protein PilE